MGSILFCNLSSSDNIGDRFSCPLDYFVFDSGIKLDLNQLKNPINDPVILGGGGLLHEGHLITFENLANNRNILWGIGINEHDLTVQYFPSYLYKYGLIGLRDWNNPFNYIPCVSCMSSLFDNNNNKPQYDFIVYEHKDAPIKIETKIKRSNRLNNNESFEDIIKFLTLGNIVITNSYHGAYWSLLLGKKVVIFKPFSNRFFGFKYQPLICDESNWTSKLKWATSAPTDYLFECRSLNTNFYHRARTFLESSF